MDYIYLPTANFAASPIELSSAARQHMAALRLRDNEPVTILNGKGAVARCRARLHGRNPVGLELDHVDIVDRGIPLGVIVGILDNRDRQEFAVEKAVELGADTILVTAMERSSHLRSPLTRLVAKAEAAMVQSGRAWMPRVDVCSSISEALVRMDGYNILVGDAQGSQPQPDDVVGPVAVVVGPEGGLTAYEIEQLVQRRCTSWRIGQARLRAETAAIAMLATVAALR